MARISRIPTPIGTNIFPWIDQDYENLEQIVNAIGSRLIIPTFHETVYPLMDTLLTQKMRLIVLNISLPPGEYDVKKDPVIEALMKEMSSARDLWKIGSYLLKELRKSYSANRNTTIFATSYDTHVFDSSSQQHFIVKDIAINAGANKFYNLIHEHQALTQDIISYFKKK